MSLLNRYGPLIVILWLVLLATGCSTTPGKAIVIEDKRDQIEFLITKEFRWNSPNTFIDAQCGIERISGLADTQQLDSGFVNPDYNRIDAPATLNHQADITHFEISGSVHWQPDLAGKIQLEAGPSINVFTADVSTESLGSEYRYSSEGLVIGLNAGLTIVITDWLGLHFNHHQGVAKISGNAKQTRAYLRLKPFKHFAINAGHRSLELSEFSNSTSDIHFKIEGPWVGLELVF